MQRPHRPVHRNAQADVAAITKKHQRPPRLVHRSIRGNEQISAQQILVQLQRALQIRGAGLFLALENHFQVHAQGDSGSTQRVDRRKECHNRRLVVRRRTRVDAPIVVVRARMFVRKRNPLAARLDRVAAQHRLERLAIGPRRGINRLPIVVRIKNHRALRIRRVQFPKNHRPAPGNRQRMRLDSPRLQHFHQVRGILLNIFRIARQVRYRQKFRQLSNDAVFIVHTIVPHRLSNLRGRKRGLRNRLLREGRPRR